MTKTIPYRSTAPGTTVFHDNARCPEGLAIESRNLASGAVAGLKQCPKCAELNRPPASSKQ